MVVSGIGVLSSQFEKEELEDWGFDIDKKWEEDFDNKNSEINTDELEKI